MMLLLHGIDQGILSMIRKSQAPGKVLRMLDNFVPFVVRVTERGHYENASISPFGLPSFASVPVWDH